MAIPVGASPSLGFRNRAMDHEVTGLWSAEKGPTRTVHVLEPGPASSRWKGLCKCWVEDSQLVAGSNSGIFRGSQHKHGSPNSDNPLLMRKEE